MPKEKLVKMMLISLNEAASRGIDRIRIPTWANKMDHLKIDIIDNKPGPWLHLFCPFNKACNGRDPVDTLWILGKINPDEYCYEIYQGPLPDSNEYREAAAAYPEMPEK